VHGLPVYGFTPPDTDGAPVPGHLDMPAKPSLSHHASQKGIHTIKPPNNMTGMSCHSGSASHTDIGTGSQSIQRRPANNI
jgi:hypothetical protein